MPETATERRVLGKTWTALALLLGTVFSRFSFRSQILYHWDSVNFAFAMRKFDVAAEQPHSPGYIGYVWLCRLVDVLFHDPQVTMVWIAITSSGLAVVAMYLLGRSVFGQRTGLVTALFLASSPLFWFYGEIALPHTLDTFLVIVSAWLLYEVTLGRIWAIIPAAVGLATAGGLRQQTPVFLALLALFAGVRFLQRTGWRRGWRRGVLAVAVFGLLCAGWFFPLINSAGGLTRYLRVVGTFSERFDRTTSVFLGAGMEGLSRNLRRLGMYTLYGWSTALLPLVVYGLVWLWRRQLTRINDICVQWERPLFLLAWVSPSLFFYILIHMGQQGLVFVFLPVLLLVSAWALVRLLEKRGHIVLGVVVALLCVINATQFIALPEYPLGEEHFKVLSWDTLRNNDAYYQGRFRAIREHLPVESTVIIAARWRHVQYYLPEYKWLPFKRETLLETGGREFDTANLGLTREITVALFDSSPQISNQISEITSTLPLRDDDTMTCLPIEPGDIIRLEPRGVVVEP